MTVTVPLDGLVEFMEECVYPAEPAFARQAAGLRQSAGQAPVVRVLARKAKLRGLWNCCAAPPGPCRRAEDGLPHRIELAGIAGRSPLGPLALNCPPPGPGAAPEDHLRYCMQVAGLADRTLQLACRHATSGDAGPGESLGVPLAARDRVRELVAYSRTEIEEVRALCQRVALQAASAPDLTVLVAMAEVAARRMAGAVAGRVLTLHGGPGRPGDLALLYLEACARDPGQGPGTETIARRELGPRCPGGRRMR
jgi:hypothetical protein